MCSEYYEYEKLRRAEYTADHLSRCNMCGEFYEFPTPEHNSPPRLFTDKQFISEYWYLVNDDYVCQECKNAMKYEFPETKVITHSMKVNKMMGILTLIEKSNKRIDKLRYQKLHISIPLWYVPI